MELPPLITPVRKQLTRDLRLQIRTLYQVGLGYAQIATQLGVTARQVQYARNHRLTPQNRRSGAPSVLDHEAIKYLISFVSATRVNRRLPYYQIPSAIGWPLVSEPIIQHALEKEGFRRHPARRKPVISEKNRLARLAWAVEHLEWTKEQWNLMLWTDETWVTNRHTKIWVTRRSNEAYEDTCVIDKESKPHGWLFWGSFSGQLGLGPGLFWEKEWGSINSITYIEHIVPQMVDWIKYSLLLFLQQYQANMHF
jgi:hypothetical protein